MQLSSLSVEGLFGSLDHTIPFPIPRAESHTPSLVILHGPNGVGKTTLLRMLDGLLRLDFNPFRQVPLSSCTLTFSNSDSITVRPQGKDSLRGLDVSYKGKTVRLDPTNPGPLHERDIRAVEEFRQLYFADTESMSLEFVDTERLHQLAASAGSEEDIPRHEHLVRTWALRRHVPRNPKARRAADLPTLGARVVKFIQEVQVNYRTFFATTEPDFFSRIIERLTDVEQVTHKPSDLRTQLKKILSQDRKTKRLGLEPDRWNYDQLLDQLQRLQRRRADIRKQALAVLASYVELLESRAAERALIAERLFTFERLLSSFYMDKRIRVHPKDGIRIFARSGRQLDERQLSSGEFHLLFLMVAALVTRRRGTVIAIDEPEMSMHIAWQRRLVPALIECASNAQPLFILATHSPDLASSYPEALVELSGAKEES